MNITLHKLLAIISLFLTICLSIRFVPNVWSHCLFPMFVPLFVPNVWANVCWPREPVWQFEGKGPTSVDWRTIYPLLPLLLKLQPLQYFQTEKNNLDNLDNLFLDNLDRKEQSIARISKLGPTSSLITLNSTDPDWEEADLSKILTVCKHTRLN